MKQDFGKSYLLHGAIGAILAYPVLIVTIALAARIGIFWLVIIGIPASVAIVLYLLRVKLTRENADNLGCLSYGLMGAIAGLLTLGLTVIIVPAVAMLGINIQAMVIAAVISGAIVGVSSLFLDQKLHASNLFQ